MRKSGKPVRKCSKCLLNLGDFCWGFKYPRDQWRRGKCTAFGSQPVYAIFREWEKDLPAKTRRQIRQEIGRKRKSRPQVAHLEGEKELQGGALIGVRCKCGRFAESKYVSSV